MLYILYALTVLAFIFVLATALVNLNGQTQ